MYKIVNNNEWKDVESEVRKTCDKMKFIKGKKYKYDWPLYYK